MRDSLAWLDELAGGRYRSVRECAPYQDAHAERLSTMNSCRLICGTEEALSLIRRRFPAQYLLFTAAQRQVGAFMDTVSMKKPVCAGQGQR